MAAGVTVESTQGLNNRAVQKFHVAGFLVGDESVTLPAISALVNADGTVNVPTGMVPAGWITTDGITRSRSMTTDLTLGWQSLAAIRSDVTADAISYKIKLQENNIVTFALREGLTIAQAKAQFTSAGYAIARNTSGIQPVRRVLVVARDTLYNVTLAQFLPNVSLSALADEVLGRATERQLDATLNALFDNVAQTDSYETIAGPGVAQMVAANAPGWSATTTYATNATVALTTGGGGVVQATTAGTSGSTQPTLPVAVGGTVVDGSVTWTRQS